MLWPFSIDVSAHPQAIEMIQHSRRPQAAIRTRMEYRAWCTRRGVRPRYGAVGKYGSVALIERFIKTLKDEGLRRIIVPLAHNEISAEVSAIVDWYNTSRPHEALAGATPNEICPRVRPARDGPRFEIRERCPTCRGEKLRGEKAVVVKLETRQHAGRSHLPVIRLRSAAWGADGGRSTVNPDGGLRLEDEIRPPAKRERRENPSSSPLRWSSGRRESRSTR